MKSRQALLRYKIDIVQAREVNYLKETSPISRLLKCHNPTNCVHITPSYVAQSKNGSKKTFVPSVLLSNVMSLAVKMDEIRHYPTYANLDLVCLTETWLQKRIHDNVVSISGFSLARSDRETSIHGGVCTRISKA